MLRLPLLALLIEIFEVGALLAVTGLYERLLS
jgi:hypothetical protein